MEAMVTAAALNYFCRRPSCLPSFPSRVRHLRCRRRSRSRLELLLLLFLTNSACSSPLFNFSAPRPPSISFSFSFSGQLSRFGSERRKNGRKGKRGNFPSHPYSVQLGSREGKVNVGFSVADKVADFCRLRNWHPSTARAAATAAAVAMELTAAKVGSGHRSRSSINQSDTFFLPSFLSHLSIRTKSLGGYLSAAHARRLLICSVYSGARLIVDEISSQKCTASHLMIICFRRAI